MHFVLKPSHFSLFCYSWNSLGFFSLLFFVYCNCLLIRIRRRIFGWFFIDVWLSMKHLPFYKHSESTNFVAWIRTSTRLSNAIILNQRRRRRRKKHWNARIDTQTANVQFTQWPDRNRSTSTPLLKCEYEFQHIFQRRAHSLYMEFTWVPRYVREFQPWFGPKRDAQNSTREKYRAARCT